MKTKLVLAVPLAVLLFALSSAFGQSNDSTTSQFMFFAGLECTINGVPAPVGTSIDAFSPSGVHCGHQDVDSAGRYKYMAVYGKDSHSPVSDGYPSPGDHITFKVDGQVAFKLGPDSDVWSSYGDNKIMNLAVSDGTNFSVVAAAAPPEGAGGADSTVHYTVKVTNEGDGFDLIALDVTSLRGWLVTGAIPGGLFYAAAESKDLPLTVKIPDGTPLGTQDTLTVVAHSLLDPTATTTKKIVTTVNDITGVAGGNFAVPGLFTLDQNFPNPFNPETVIAFSLEKGGNVMLAIYDILGRQVTTLQQGYLAAGQYKYRWNATDSFGRTVASGVYFYRLTSDQVSLTRKMALLK